jgi:asparagine synthase (glutamine-hydrolysing)
MRRALRHRGPDGEGSWSEEGCGLCHTRLSILDLSQRGQQPMVSASGRYVLSYNGEIYNFRELRAELQGDGCEFQSEGDTEVVLQLLERKGIDAIARLEGMFAFALFDRVDRALVVARDRLGIKPLFWGSSPEGFAFASEPKALPPFVDRGSPTTARIAEYLAFRHWADAESPLSGVQTLAPGHYLVTDGRETRVTRWWEGPTISQADPESTWEVVSTAVRRQLVSDVPVGIFLSGGVDSALTSAAAVDALPSVDSFTVGFSEAEWDESDRARVVSQALGTRAHEIFLDEETYLRGLGEAIFYLDAPLNHAHSVHLLALSRAAREHITVALTGEGSDELFAGYPRYRLFLAGQAMRLLPNAISRPMARGLRGFRPRWARLLDAANPDPAVAAAVNAAFLPIDEACELAGLADPGDAIATRRERAATALAAGRSPIEALLELERSTYLVSLLQRMDRMSMAAGLECRVPLLDETMVDFAASLRPEKRINLRETKKPMRDAAAARFGNAYATAPKSGFGVPVGAWLRNDGGLGRLFGRLLDEPRTRDRGWFDVDRARRYFDEHREGSRDRSELLWGLLNLELWARVGIDGEAAKRVTV